MIFFKKKLTPILFSVACCLCPFSQFQNHAFAGLLTEAAERGDLRGVVSLLQKGVDINEMDHLTSIDALYIQMESGEFSEQLKSTISILQENFKNEPLPGFTALHFASLNGHSDIVQTLLRNPKVQVNRTDFLGIAPLHLAVLKGHEKEVELLLQKNDINVNQAELIFFSNPLQLAISKNRKKIAKKLLEHPNIKVNQTDIYFQTVLHHATTIDSEIFEILLKRKDIDVNAMNDFRETPLHLAIKHGNNKTITRLLQHPNIAINQANINGNSALSIATLKDQAHIVKILLRRSDIDVNHQNNAGMTPLHYAVLNGNLRIVQLLTQRRNIQAHIQNAFGKTALQLAIENNRPEIAQLLRIELHISLKKQLQPFLETHPHGLRNYPLF